MASNTLTFLAGAAIIYATYLFRDFRRAIASVQNHPGYRTLFAAQGVIGYLFPAIGKLPGLVHTMAQLMDAKYDIFKSFDCDIYTVIGALPNPTVTILLADAEVIKEVTTSRARFPKPVEIYSMLTFFGQNILTTEGDEWKRYRKITAPAFSDRNSQLVWDETAKVMLDLFDNVWGEKNVISIDHCVDITLPIALSVIGIAGEFSRFGRTISWTDESEVPAGHSMTFKDALHTVSAEVLARVVCPRWLAWTTPSLRKTFRAYDELHSYMSQMITDRRSGEDKSTRYDLFASLLDANNEDGEVKLSHSELIGNVFIFQLAGHETTAHTLAFTFALLALYPDEQEILFQHIMNIIPDGRIPAYAEMPLFTQSIAVFYETLRLFPPVPTIPKRSVEDTSLTTTNAAGVRTTIPIPRGATVVLATTGLHYNPRYWPDPHSFTPARFLSKDWNRDAFLPFSAGARACLGRKFFETEGIMVLTMMVSRYKITIKEEPEFAHETFEEKKARVLKCQFRLSTTPDRVPLVFTLRQQ